VVDDDDEVDSDVVDSLVEEDEVVSVEEEDDVVDSVVEDEDEVVSLEEDDEVVDVSVFLVCRNFAGSPNLMEGMLGLAPASWQHTSVRIRTRALISSLRFFFLGRSAIQ
jgi:hypothetical protein